MAATSAESSVQLLRAVIGPEEVMVPLDHVAEIVRMVDLQKVPGGGALVRGALNLRGEILPVVDISSLLDQPVRNLGPEQYIVILTSDGKAFGVVVDDTPNIVEVRSDERRDVAGYLPQRQAIVEVARVGERIVPILDPTRLFES